MNKLIIITNNCKIYEKHSGRLCVDYSKDRTFLDVLITARDYIHKGYKLLTHPLAGSLKPNQTPIKTVFVQKLGNGESCCESVMMIESALDAYYKFTKCRKTPLWDDRIRNDFMTIDLSIADGVLDNPVLSRV